jgi:succinate dehydrogenase / fumarate reductase, membrane anchor subunit
MSLRSPLGRVLGFGSAKGGSAHWYSQRVTGLALVLLGSWFVVSLACLGGASYEQVSQWLRSPADSALMLLLVVVAAWHAALGLQVVIEDYVSGSGARTVALIALKFALVAAALLGVLAVLRIAFGVAA